jgi:hypothetical protein
MPQYWLNPGSTRGKNPLMEVEILASNERMAASMLEYCSKPGDLGTGRQANI